LLPEDDDTVANPKVSAAYLLRASTRLHGSAGTGFRPPNGFELTFTTNPALNPERTTSVDAGVEQSFWSRRISVDVTWFYSRFRDQIVTLSPAAQSLSHWTSDNLANSEASGTEVALYLRPGKGLSFRGAYTYLDTTVLSLSGSSTLVQGIFRLGQQFLRRPRHSGSYMATWQHGRLLIESGAILHGRTLDIEPNLAAGEYPNPFYATFDAGGQFEIGHGVSLTAKARNLLDRTYEESLGFPALGRSYSFGVKWHWMRN
jgi:outer membrane receptor protein involved in Fe transport